MCGVTETTLNLPRPVGLLFTGAPISLLIREGVRIGTAEIYLQVETTDEVVDSVVVGQKWENLKGEEG